MDLIDTLAAIRRYKNMSTKDLHTPLGCSLPQVSRLELKETPMNIREAAAYAKAVGAKITVTIEFDGFSREVPFYAE